jgi:hypothetical protein
MDAKLTAFSVIRLVLVPDLRLRKLLRLGWRGQRREDGRQGNQGSLSKETST